jgi:hypothetical protein
MKFPTLQSLDGDIEALQLNAVNDSRDRLAARAGYRAAALTIRFDQSLQICSQTALHLQSVL